MIRPLRKAALPRAPRRVLLLALASLLPFLAGCGNQGTADEVNVGTAADTSDLASGSIHDQMMAMNDRMVQELGAAGTGDFDNRFIDLMIAHHQGAVALARDASARAQRPEVRAMADSMARAQELEISRLAAMRTGGTGGTGAGTGTGTGGTMGSDTSGTTGTTGR